MKYRTFLFLILLALFLLSAPVVILYSQGYRINFQSLTLVRTGGLFVKTSPPGTDIFLDGKKRFSTSQMFGTKFIQDLFPRIYRIRAEKEGFHPWEKDIEVKEKQTTEIKHIVLVPLNPERTLLAEQGDSFFADETKRMFVALAQTKEQSQTSFFSVDLSNLKTTKSFVFRDDPVLRSVSDIAIEDVSADGKILISAQSKKRRGYFLIDTNSMTIKKIPQGENDYRAMKFHPTDSRYLVAHVNDNLYLFDTADSNLRLLAKQVSAFSIEKTDAYYIENREGSNEIVHIALDAAKSAAESKNANTTEQERFSYPQDIPSPEKISGAFRILKNKETLLLLEKTLFLFNPSEKAWVALLSDVEGMKRLQRTSTVLAWNTNTVWILGENNSPKNIEQPNYSILATMRYQNRITEPFSFGKEASYILAGIDGQIEIREVALDDEKNGNIVRLQIATDSIFFDARSGTLYSLSEKKISRTKLYP